MEGKVLIKCICIGPPGSGKSNLVASIARQLKPSSNEITFQTEHKFTQGANLESLTLESVGSLQLWDLSDEIAPAFYAGTDIALVVLTPRIFNEDIKTQLNYFLPDLQKKAQNAKIFFVINQWDLVPDQEKEALQRKYSQVIKASCPSVMDEDIIVYSAKNSFIQNANDNLILQAIRSFCEKNPVEKTRTEIVVGNQGVSGLILDENGRVIGRKKLFTLASFRLNNFVFDTKGFFKTLCLFACLSAVFLVSGFTGVFEDIGLGINDIYQGIILLTDGGIEVISAFVGLALLTAVGVGLWNGHYEEVDVENSIVEDIVAWGRNIFLEMTAGSPYFPSPFSPEQEDQNSGELTSDFEPEAKQPIRPV